MKRFLKIFFAIIIIGAISIVATNRINRKKSGNENVDISVLKDAYKAVQDSYVEKPDSKKVVESMINGMLAALDPHSSYLPPEPYKEMEIQMAGSFGGVGIELGMKDNKLTVISPIDDTPAFRAGIHANDHIAMIDSKSTVGMTISQAVKLMRGEKGKLVTLTILRGDSPKPLVFPIIRDIIKIKSVKYRTLEDGYALIRIGQFQQNSGAEFKDALKKIKDENKNGLKGLIIDLRYNPGGLLNSAIDIANSFVGKKADKTLIVSTKGRAAGAKHDYHASLGEKESGYPIVVLINGGSASASEILAGALQDHKLAIIMGSQSFGKGSVQSIMPLKDGAALKLTTARYYTPSGRSIQAEGITPDIVVENRKLSDALEKKDNGLKEKDLENILKPEDTKEKPLKQDEKSAKDGEKEKINIAPPPFGDVEKDYQLKRGVELLKSLNLVQQKI